MKQILTGHILTSYIEGNCTLDEVFSRLGDLGWTGARITLMTTALMPQWGFSDN